MRQTKGIYAWLLAVLCLLASACSTQKNTWATRHYHSMTTRYNVRFNGEKSFYDGIGMMEKSHTEDFSELLPVYVASDQRMARVAKNKMDACIEKCEKAIKTHSIRVKPEKKPKRGASEKEKQFYEQEEFNPQMGEMFLLMAKAQYHEAEYMSAIATCTYIIRHFKENKLLCDEARIWQARSYCESDWMYDAENIFVKMNEEGYHPELTGMYSVAYADFLIRRQQYADAIPLLEIGLEHTHKRSDRQRYTYILAQLCQKTGDDDGAYRYFRAVPKMNPPYEMDLNARIRQTEVLGQDSPKQALHKLKRMSRSPNNLDYLDAIHYAIGNLYLCGGDTAKAVEHYRTAVEKSTKNGPYKAQAQLCLADYHYNRDEFLEAQPCYADAKSLLSSEYRDYERIVECDRVLGLLCPDLETIHDQDSLQALAVMPEEQRNHLIDSLIVEARKKARAAAREQAQNAALNANSEITAQNRRPTQEAPTQTPAMGNADNSWYFYNETAKKQGAKEFERVWGRRKLEDNWRIKNKGDFFADLNTATEFPGDTSFFQSPIGEDLLAGDTAAEIIIPEFEASDDPTQMGYYLKDIPFTPEQKEASDDLIREALFKAGKTFREEMHSDRLALKTFAELQRRFPADTLYLPEAGFISYLVWMQQQRLDSAEVHRARILSVFPNTPQAGLLSDSLYLTHLDEMYRIEDSLYEATYYGFLAGYSDTVKYNCALVDSIYKYSELRPNFMFLRSLEAVKDGDGDLFIDLITRIISEYPESDLAKLSTQMAAYWAEGRRPVGFNGFFGDGELSDSLMLDSLASRFIYEPQALHCVAIAYPADSVNANRLLFDVALYNFSNFLIRDYELSLEKLAGLDVLMIRSFESAADALRYAAWMAFLQERPEEKYPGIEVYVFSNANLELISSGKLTPPASSFGSAFPRDAYLQFFRRYYLSSEENGEEEMSE